MATENMHFNTNKCELCPRKCGVDRKTAVGYCKLPDGIYVAHVSRHFWEEPPISGHKGSGTVFFNGCTMRCAFCQNAAISRTVTARGISVSRLADIFKELDEQAENINLVSPTPYADKIIKALSIYRPKNPVVYNSGGYERVETLKMLDGLVDIYLPDFKYSDDALAKQLSDCRDYTQTALCAIEEMLRQRGAPRFKDGLMKSGVIVRHLILPSYIRNSLGVIKLFGERFKDKAWFSLMGQYTPINVENLENLNRNITPIEYKAALKALENAGIENGFVQELSSAKCAYIPAFCNNPDIINIEK